MWKKQPQNRMQMKQLTEAAGVTKATIQFYIHPIQKDKRKLFEEDDILFVECYGELRKIGYRRDLDFHPSAFILHRDFLERLVEEEGRILVSQVSGKVSLEQLIRMVEEGTAISNLMMGLIRKRLIVETVGKYAAEFPSEALPPPSSFGHAATTAETLNPAGPDVRLRRAKKRDHPCQL